MKGAIWTPELTQALIAHRKAGMTHGQIAKKMQITRNMVTGKLHRLGMCGKTRRAYLKGSVRPIMDDWDRKLFEPYGVRKARLAAEGRV